MAIKVNTGTHELPKETLIPTLEDIKPIKRLAEAAMPKTGGTFTGTISVPLKTSAPTNSGTLLATEAQVYTSAQNSHTHSNKSVLDNTTASYTLAEAAIVAKAQTTAIEKVNLNGAPLTVTDKTVSISAATLAQGLLADSSLQNASLSNPISATWPLSNEYYLSSPTISGNTIDFIKAPRPKIILQHTSGPNQDTKTVAIGDIRHSEYFDKLSDTNYIYYDTIKITPENIGALPITGGEITGPLAAKGIFIGDVSPAAVAKGITSESTIAADGYKTAPLLPAITLGKKGTDSAGIGASANDMEIKFATTLLDGSKWTDLPTMSWNFIGNLKENGSKIYSPNNKPTPADIGAAPQLHTHNYIAKVTSTNNAIAKFNGASGEVKNSGILVDDNNNVTIPGNLTVSGTTLTVNSTAVEIEDRLIKLAKNNTTGLTNYAGVYVPKYDGINAGGLLFDQHGTAYVGDIEVDATGNASIPATDGAQPILVRAQDSALSNGNLLRWDTATKSAIDSGISYSNVFSTTNKPNIFVGTDTRNTNETPQWYVTNKGDSSIVTELKSISVISAQSILTSQFGQLTTFTSWHDVAGGLPVQILTSSTDSGKIAIRSAISLTAWGSWEEIGKSGSISNNASNNILYVTSIDDGETIELTDAELAAESYQGRVMSVYPSTYTQVCRHPIYREKGIIPFKYMKGFLEKGTIPSDARATYEKLSNGNYLLTYFMGQRVWDRYLIENYNTPPITWEQFYAKYAICKVALCLYNNSASHRGIEWDPIPILKKKPNSTYEFTASTENMLVSRVLFAKDRIEYEVNIDDWEQCGINNYNTNFYVGLDAAFNPNISMDPIRSNFAPLYTVRKFPLRYFSGLDNANYSIFNTTGVAGGRFWEPFKYEFQEELDNNHRPGGEFKNQIIGVLDSEGNPSTKIWDGTKWKLINTTVLVSHKFNNLGYKKGPADTMALISKYATLESTSADKQKLTNIYTDKILNLACNATPWQMYSQPAYIAEWLQSETETHRLTLEQMKQIYRECNYLVSCDTHGAQVIIGLDELCRRPSSMLARIKYTSNKGTFTEDCWLSYSKDYDTYSVPNEVIEQDCYFSPRIYNTTSKELGVDLTFGLLGLSKGILVLEIYIPQNNPGSDEIVTSIDSVKIVYSIAEGAYQGTEAGIQRLAKEPEQNIIVDIMCQALQTLSSSLPASPSKASRMAPQTRTLKEWLEVAKK